MGTHTALVAHGLTTPVVTVTTNTMTTTTNTTIAAIATTAPTIATIVTVPVVEEWDETDVNANVITTTILPNTKKSDTNQTSIIPTTRRIFPEGDLTSEN